MTKKFDLSVTCDKLSQKGEYMDVNDFLATVLEQDESGIKWKTYWIETSDYNSTVDALNGAVIEINSFLNSITKNKFINNVQMTYTEFDTVDGLAQGIMIIAEGA